MPWARKSAPPILLRLFLEHVDEGLADELALLFGIGLAGEPGEELLFGVHVDQRDVVVVAEQGDDLLGLVQPHQPVVDEDAGQLVADRLVDQHRGDRAESTPPDRPQMTLPSPTWARISSILVLRNSAIVQSPARPQTWRTKLASSLPPSGVWTTSGWNCVP